MGSFDTFTWQALTAVLTLLGLAGSVVFWRLRGPVAGLRMLAVALLPAAAYLTGTLRLLWEIGAAVVRWAVHLTFSPVMWLGVGLAVTSVLIFVLAGVLRRRGGGGAPRRESLPRSASRAPAQPMGTPSKPAVEDDDMADIEAILKRHGIS
ncbi:MAG TPA: hypothetical protein VFR87_07270 [Nocardioidaceae bacterium]|nr:hypothetical protein [Nocardioidaceae bacterium]